MADIAKVGTPSLASILPPPNMQDTGLVAGEALGAFDVVYIKASDGKVYKANGTAATAPARARGYVPAAYALNEKGVTIYYGDITVNYGANLAIGADYFLSATAGALADAASVGGTTVLGFAIDAQRIRLMNPR